MRRQQLHSLFLYGQYINILTIESMPSSETAGSIVTFMSHIPNYTKMIVKPMQNVSLIHGNLLQNLGKIIWQTPLLACDYFHALRVLHRIFSNSHGKIQKYFVISICNLKWYIREVTFIINHRYSSPFIFWPASFLGFMNGQQIAISFSNRVT